MKAVDRELGFRVKGFRVCLLVFQGFAMVWV